MEQSLRRLVHIQHDDTKQTGVGEMAPDHCAGHDGTWSVASGLSMAHPSPRREGGREIDIENGWSLTRNHPPANSECSNDL